MRRVSHFRYALAFLALLLWLAAGCSDDDNPAGDTNEDHLHAAGVMLIHGTDTLVTAEGTVVTGSVSVTAGDTLGPCEVWFFDPDSGWYHPEEEPSLDHDHELLIDVEDETIVSVILGEEVAGADPWSAFFAGRQSGATVMRVKIMHLDHPDYTSPELPVLVTP